MTTTVLNDGILKFDKWKNSANTITHGTIIGHASTTYNTGNDTYTDTNATQANTGVTLTYTPKYANSILMVYGAVGTRSNGAGRNGAAAGIKRDGTAMPSSPSWPHHAFYYHGDTVNHHRKLIMRAFAVSNNTSPTTFTTYVSNDWGAVEISWAWGQHKIEVWEIQQ